MSLRAEMLLAETGVLRTVPVTRDDAIAGEAGLIQMQRRIASWCREQDPAPRPFKACRERDAEKTHRRLAEQPTEQEHAEMTAEFVDPVLAIEWWEAREAARMYLVNARPKFALESATGEEVLPLSQDDAEEWLSLVDIVEDPMRVVEELEMFSLTPTQANAFKECFPQLFSICHAFALDTCTDMEAKKRRITWERDSVLRVFLGIAPTAKVEVQGSDQPPKEPEPQKIDLQSALTQTPAQRITTPKVA